MKMKVIEKKGDCVLFQSDIIKDNRGWFSVQLNVDMLKQYGFKNMVQLNHSFSLHKGTIRGFNFQEYPFQQAKIVRCVRGKIFSVAVDIDYTSQRFGCWYGYELSEGDNKLMYIPNHYAHGFITMLKNSEMEYFTDQIYSFDHAKSIRFDDSTIGVDWTLNGLLSLDLDCLSEKNRKAISLEEYRKESKNDFSMHGNI